MCLEAIKSAGLEIVEYSDLADSKSNPLVASAQDPWHSPLKGPKFSSLSSLFSLENVRIHCKLDRILILCQQIRFQDLRCIHGAVT